jgi:hypothetical protein
MFPGHTLTGTKKKKKKNKKKEEEEKKKKKEEEEKKKTSVKSLHDTTYEYLTRTYLVQKETEHLK